MRESLGQVVAVETSHLEFPAGADCLEACVEQDALGGRGFFFGKPPFKKNRGRIFVGRDCTSRVQ